MLVRTWHVEMPTKLSWGKTHGNGRRVRPRTKTGRQNEDTHYVRGSVTMRFTNQLKLSAVVHGEA
jgi:hypothetical protein